MQPELAEIFQVFVFHKECTSHAGIMHVQGRAHVKKKLELNDKNTVPHIKVRECNSVTSLCEQSSPYYAGHSLYIVIFVSYFFCRQKAVESKLESKLSTAKSTWD